MNEKVLLGAASIFLLGAFMYAGGDFLDQNPEVKTINSFSGDIYGVDTLKIHQGEPVYIKIGYYRTPTFYNGKRYGQNFDSVVKSSIIDDKLVYEAEQGDRGLIVVDGEVKVNTSATITDFDLLNNSLVYVSGPYEGNKTLYRGEEAIRNFSDVEEMKTIGGEIAILGSKNYEEFLWYNGSVIDRNAIFGGLKSYREKPLYRVDDGRNYGLAIDGEKLDINGSVDEFNVVQDKLAVSFEDEGKILGETDISYCNRIEEVKIINGKIACSGPNKTEIYYGEESIETPYNQIREPFEHNDSLTFIANHKGASLIATRNKVLTENYTWIWERFSYNNSLYYTAVKQGRLDFFRDGNKVTNLSVFNLNSEEKPLLTAQNVSQTLYRGDKPVKKAEWIDEPAISEKGLTYQYHKDGKNVLVTPEKNISRYGHVTDYGYGDKGLAYLAVENQKTFLVYNDQRSINFSETDFLTFVNNTPYFTGVKGSHDLLMKGHEIHTNLSEDSYPDFMEKKDEDNYNYTERNDNTLIQYNGEEYGPFKSFPDSITAKNNTLTLIEETEKGQYLYHERNRYGPYKQIEGYKLGEDKLFFFATENGKVKLNSLPL